MPNFRLQQPLLSGLGVAGAVLAAVVVAFTLASGIIAYNLTSPDPLVHSSRALVLEPLSAGGGTRSPIVLDRARARSARGRATPIAGAVAAASTGRGGAAGSLSAGSGGSASGTQNGDAGTKPATSGGRPAGGGLHPIGQALDETGQAVGATTGPLARRLQKVVAELAARTQPAVDRTRAQLRETVGRSAGTLARLLGAPPQG